MITAITTRFGRLDVVVIAAARWRPVMTGQKKGGLIVTFGDWAAQRPYRNFAPDLISKGAIPTLSKRVAVDLVERNPCVRGNCIEPAQVMFPAEQR